MEDLSLHILDIVENATSAGATLVEIHIEVDSENNLFALRIRDDGRGMDQEMLSRVRDPFVTTRRTRRVGLGLSMLEQAAQEAGGYLRITSQPGRGTEVSAVFKADHIDRRPLGDIGLTMISLIVGSPEVDFVCECDLDGKKTSLDTREIKAEIKDVASITDPAILKLIRDLFTTN